MSLIVSGAPSQWSQKYDPIEIYVAAPAQAVDEKDMAAKFMAFVPQLIQMVPQLIQAFKNGVAQGAAAPPVDVPPAGGVS